MMQPPVPAAQPIARQGCDVIARHGEMVSSAAARLQGDHVHTPLVIAGHLALDRHAARTDARRVGDGSKPVVHRGAGCAPA